MVRHFLDVVRTSDGLKAQLHHEDGTVGLRNQSKLVQRLLEPRVHVSTVTAVDDVTVRYRGSDYTSDDPAQVADFLATIQADTTPEPRSLPPSFASPLGEGEPRWQYAIINVGMFNSSDRMASILAEAGHAGWELITVYDKASNWFAGMEKGFMLMKRPVPLGVEVDEWCVRLSSTISVA